MKTTLPPKLSVADSHPQAEFVPTDSKCLLFVPRSASRVQPLSGGGIKDSTAQPLARRSITPRNIKAFSGSGKSRSRFLDRGPAHYFKS